jgi:hypothetical protein
MQSDAEPFMQGRDMKERDHVRQARIDRCTKANAFMKASVADRDHKLASTLAASHARLAMTQRRYHERVYLERVLNSKNGRAPDALFSIGPRVGR